jgi:hypothetical protein
MLNMINFVQTYSRNGHLVRPGLPTCSPDLRQRGEERKVNNVRVVQCQWLVPFRPNQRMMDGAADGESDGGKGRPGRDQGVQIVTAGESLPRPGKKLRITSHQQLE